MKNVQYKAGDMVRVRSRYLKGSCLHAFKSGQVVTVVQHLGRTVEVQGVNTSGLGMRGSMVYQVVDADTLKLAKQAMRKRDGYAKRRG